MSFFIKIREMDVREFACRQEESRQANQPAKFFWQAYQIQLVGLPKVGGKSDTYFYNY